MVARLSVYIPMGGDLGGTGGTVPQNLRWMGGPCIRHPNILRSPVIGYEAKYELTKKMCDGGIFCCEIEVFVQEKGSFMLYIRFKTVETDKRQTTYSRSLKKRSSEIMGGKMEFSLKRSFENLFNEYFSV